ncbi:MAG: 4Fe-4S ferredoxin [Desulfobacterium sp.]|nr:4Fe-4S ferredoxin [Desulfobacterium sp.]
MPDKKVLIIGGGVAGLSAAIELAKLDVKVVLIEKEKTVGGYARQFTCKATDECVKCGACIVEGKIDEAVSHPNITICAGVCLTEIVQHDRFVISFIDRNNEKQACEVDAVVMATGFQPFDPINKPFGYKRFDDVITNLDLEKRLHQERAVKRPSDGSVPGKIAFIQCVGSRDSSLNHLWCSKVCCGSSLRMAKLIKSREESTEISFFYIDVQTFGKDFQYHYDLIRDQVRMIRAIPGDIFLTADRKLKLEYYLPAERKQIEELFDLVVLSVGITPNRNADPIAEKIGLKSTGSGFLDEQSMVSVPGVFTVGTARGPKSIAESVADAGRVALDVLNYFKAQHN